MAAVKQTSSGLTFKKDAKRLLPYSKFKFVIEIGGFKKAGFHKCSALEATAEVMKYRDGGDSNQYHKGPGTVDYSNITLERGMSDDTDMYDWMTKIAALDDANSKSDYKKDLSIVLQDRDGSEVKRWNVYGAFPVSYKTDEFDAESNDPMLEYLELAIDGFELKKK